MNERVQRKNKLKRHLTRLNRRIAQLGTKVSKSLTKYNIDEYIGLSCTLAELDVIQKMINALSGPVDEKELLQQSMNRTKRRKTGKNGPI